jgi:hypothetical protein
MYYSLLLHRNNGCMNTPQSYVQRTLPVLFALVIDEVLDLLAISFARLGD